MKRGILRTASASPLPRTSRRVSWADATVEARPWGDVPDDVLVRVSAFLRCRADLVHMARVNQHWRAAVTGPRPPGLPPLPPLPPQLPWLIFPSNEAPTFYSPLTRRYHRLCGLPPDVRRARFCGSGDGGWLVVALNSPHAAHALYNLNSGHRIPLPAVFRSPSDKAEFPLVLRVATLSASPSHGPYVVAAIAIVDNRPTAAFWSEGSESWFTSGGFLTVRPQDVLYYGDAFYFVTSREGVVSFRPWHGPNGNVDLERVDYEMQQREDYDDDVGFIGGLGMMRRYLVESRGRLLMVVRYLYGEGEVRTELLRVFGFRAMAPVINVQSPRATWEPLGDELDERMLFLGPGCSRSFEVAQYDGFQDHEYMMFFLDERFVSMQSADGRRLYSFTDMGRYDMDEMTIESWPKGRRPTRSDNAPPTWWLH